MHAPLPLTRELVFIGGGHAHALALRMWGMNPLPGVRVSVINPHPTAPYSGMLPGHVAGHYSRDDLDIDLVRLARFAGARLILDRAVSIDTNARTVTLGNGRILPYHVAAVDIGITSDLPDLPGFTAFATPAKPLDTFAARWGAFRRAVAAGTLNPTIAMIGGGVGGVELALAMQHALTTDGAVSTDITLLESDTLLKHMGNRARDVLINRLASSGVRVLEGSKIDRVSEQGVVLVDGTTISASFVVGAAGARAQDWLGGCGLDLTNGFITVDKCLRSISAPDVFAVGDCAHLAHAPRPKAGVFAVRQAPILFHNLRSVLSGSSLKEFHPQSDYLKLISLGPKSALADKWNLRLQGKVLWRLKDRIDRKFMDQFHDLAPMAAPDLPKVHALGLPEVLGSKPMCGGCGAKVGAQALSEVLTTLPTGKRADVLPKPGDDAATLIGPSNNHQVITTDHLRAFTDDPWMMSRIAAVHALGDIWAMGASAQSALASIVLPPMSPEMQRFWLHEIMGSAAQVFREASCDIVGGHTSLGAELTIGFTVTGLRTGTPIALTGACPGDVLILSKPIGTGTILAGEMAMLVRGTWVEGALCSMARPQADVGALLADAHAMTDVTGFGLAGHLQAMALASNLEITVELAKVPVLPGALDLANQGVRSTLYPENLALLPGFDPRGDARAHLLFDPQTSGGLVAAVSPKEADGLLRKIKSLRYEANIIGTCNNGTPGLTIKR